MNILPSFRVALVTLLLFPFSLQAAKVYITNSRTSAPTQLMDLNWKRAANLSGSDSEIIGYDDLDNLDKLKEADVLIIASAIETITASQRNVIYQFVKSGGHLYVQSEFKINFAGNELFDYLVNKSGGVFSWEGETGGNLNPVKVASFINDGNINRVEQLDYFWNGTYGCGGNRVFPISTFNNKDYGFLYAPETGDAGRIMTTSDQDWIKIATEVGQEHRLTLMTNLLKALTNGVEDLVIPNVNISFLQQSVCPGTPIDVMADIDVTRLEYDLQWYKNGEMEAEWINKKTFESSDLVAGDILQAKITMLGGCASNDITSNIVEIERVYPLSMTMPSITGNPQICLGEPGVFVAQIDQMPDPAMVTYKWTLNDTDQNINNDSIFIANPTNGDIIRLSASFNDGCSDVIQTADDIVLEVVGYQLPSIQLLQNQSKYCLNDLAELKLVGITNEIPYEVQWNVDGQDIENEYLTYSLPSLTNDHDVFAKISYNDPCKGLVQLSSQIATIEINQPQLTIQQKQNTSCGLDNGSITLSAEGGTAPYQYSLNSEPISEVTSNLPQGMHRFQITDANQCIAEIETSIGEANPLIIDSLVIEQQACSSEESALVQLYTNPDFSGNLEVSWKDENGNVVNGNFEEGEFIPGKYTAVAMFNESCSEERKFEIKVGDLLDRVTRFFESDAEYFVSLDLGISPQEIASISWSGEGILDCSDCPSPSHMATKNQTFQVELTTINGCTYNFDVELKVNAVENLPYYAPSGFSPNGDGQNEVFEFHINQSIVSLKELLVFDRWGNVVYESKSADTTNWDGSMAGKPAEKGVYIYVAKMINLAGEEIVGNGSVMLLR